MESVGSVVGGSFVKDVVCKKVIHTAFAGARVGSVAVIACFGRRLSGGNVLGVACSGC